MKVKTPFVESLGLFKPAVLMDGQNNGYFHRLGENLTLVEFDAFLKSKNVFPSAPLTPSWANPRNYAFIECRERSLRLGEHSFHQDGDENYGEFFCLWASKYPTEILLPEGLIVTPDEEEVVLLHNRIVWHRTPTIPKATYRTERWLIRALPVVKGENYGR